jgi:hypothetical protein
MAGTVPASEFDAARVSNRPATFCLLQTLQKGIHMLGLLMAKFLDGIGKLLGNALQGHSLVAYRMASNRVVSPQSFIYVLAKYVSAGSPQ